MKFQKTWTVRVKVIPIIIFSLGAIFSQDSFIRYKKNIKKGS